MNKKELVILLSNRHVDKEVFKSNYHRFKRLMYFDAIFEMLEDYDNKKEEIKAIIIDQKMFKGNDFYKTIKLLKNKTKKIKTVVIINKSDYNLVDKLLNLGIKKVFCDSQGEYGVDLTGIIEDTLDDPYISDHVEKRTEQLLKNLIFNIEKKKQKISERIINGVKFFVINILNSIKKRLYKNEYNSYNKDNIIKFNKNIKSKKEKIKNNNNKYKKYNKYSSKRKSR